MKGRKTAQRTNNPKRITFSTANIKFSEALPPGSCIRDIIQKDQREQGERSIIRTFPYPKIRVSLVIRIMDAPRCIRGCNVSARQLLIVIGTLEGPHLQSVNM